MRPAQGHDERVDLQSGDEETVQGPDAGGDDEGDEDRERHRPAGIEPDDDHARAEAEDRADREVELARDHEHGHPTATIPSSAESSRMFDITGSLRKRGAKIAKKTR